MNKIAMNLNEKIVKLLREEFEQKEKYNDKWEYQWVSPSKSNLESNLVGNMKKTS